MKIRNLSGLQPPPQAKCVDLLPSPIGQKETGDDEPSPGGDADDRQAYSESMICMRGAWRNENEPGGKAAERESGCQPGELPPTLLA